MPMPLLPSADQGSGGHLQQVQPQLRPHQKPHPAVAAAAAAAEQEHLACPRCDSTNTKFCYYNNYNFSQPRYFCKACRRYWTHGGTLRDIPVGGGTRKNAKRSRMLPSSPLSSAPLLLSSAAAVAAGDSKIGTPLQPPPPQPPHASFTSLLSAPGPGFLALGGFGLGLDELGFGKGLWAFPAPVGGGGDPNGVAGGRGIGIGPAWQFESGDHHHLHHHHHHQHHHGGLVSAATTAAVGTGDFCSWAEPVISTPASAFK